MGIPELWNSIFLEVTRYKLPWPILRRRKMRFERTSAQSLAATVIVLAILLSGSVYAYSMPGSSSGNAQNAPSPLGDDNTSSSTTTSSDGDHTETSGSTTTTTTSSGESEQQHQSTSSSSTSTHTETEDHETEDHETSSHTEAGSSHDDDSEGNDPQQTHELNFHFVPVGTAEGRGHAKVHIRDNRLSVHLEVQRAGPSTTFTIILVAIPVAPTTSTTFSTTSTTFSTTFSTTSTSTTSSGASCAGSIGTFVTSDKGMGKAELSVMLAPGTYAIGLVLCSNNTPALVSDPTTRTTTLPQILGKEGKESETETETEEREEHKTVSAVTTGEHDKDHIKDAKNRRSIPAVVTVSDGDLSLQQLDPQFSVSASKLDGHGLLISIFAENATGPRVLLVTLNGSEWTPSSIQGLIVTLDATTIEEAASLSQVLNSSSTDPARYIILVTSAGLQLLVSIPHFSLHIIQIIPAAVSALNFLLVNGPILLTGLIIFTALSAALYSRRRKFFALLAYGGRA